MFSRPIASGAMLVLILGAVGGAAWQQQAATADAGVVEIAGPSDEAAEQVDAERSASAPSRVVESAGFPIVPEAEDESEVEAGPVVTVNGRPIGAAASEADEGTQADDAEPVEPVVPATPEREPEANETQVAVVEPPLPLPRPEGLAVRAAEPEIDYEAIAEAAYGEPLGEFMTREQRDSLAPIPAEPDRRTDANGDELVGVVGPNGEMIWIYEDQMPAMSSRVTIQRPQTVNPFGFVYD